MNWGSAQSRQGQGQGNRGWGAGSGNRFAALADNRSHNNSRQQGGGQRGTPTQAPHWRDVIRQDLITEHVTWPASCYAHQRDGGNDLQGDLSFEEARWAALCAARAGAGPAHLAGAFQEAQKQRQQQVQALMNGNRPPSLGGGAVQTGPSPLLMGSGGGLQQQTAAPATPVGQTFAAFPPQQPGQASSAGAGGFGSVAFGAGASNAGRPVFGTAASPSTNPFGSASPSAFQSSNRITFGSAQQPQQRPSNPFSSPSTPPMPFGSRPASGSFGAASPALPAFGARPAALPAFGGSVSGGPATPGAFGGAHGGAQTGSDSSSGTPTIDPAGMSATQSVAGSEQNFWTAHAFEVGKIPEDPPPAIYCH